ncbi:hypothetical protein EJB05_14283, partial [Eragrostis curvula]
MAAPPDLVDDAIAKILLRLPPDDPTCLARAAQALASRPLRSRLPSPVPRVPPNSRPARLLPQLLPQQIPRFVPTTAANPFPHQKHDGIAWWVMDCRHGRVLVQQYNIYRTAFSYFVWDPITGDQEVLNIPKMSYVDYTFAMLCAVAGCDHGGCHGGPFLVIFLCSDYRNVHVCVYSSETRV